MSTNTTILQGRFTQASTAVAQVIQLRNVPDWIHVYNITIAGANQTTAVGVEYYWQSGFPQGAMIAKFKSNAASAANLTQYLTTGGFSLIDSSASPLGVLNNGSTGVSALSNASIPVATVGSTAGMSAGNIVRMYGIAGAQQVGGIDFTIGNNTFTGTTFSLDYMSQVAVGTSGNFRVINFDKLYYPRRRFITSISQASQAVVTLSVTHGYQVGQEVRFVVPAAYGMTQMNGLQGSIVAINTNVSSGNTITVNIDSSAFSAFVFPLSAAVPFSPAEVVPMGEDTASALYYGQDILSDATVNTGYIGMSLAGGVNSPGGAANNVMYWMAGSSFSVNNQ